MQRAVSLSLCVCCKMKRDACWTEVKRVCYRLSLNTGAKRLGHGRQQIATGWDLALLDLSRERGSVTRGRQPAAADQLSESIDVVSSHTRLSGQRYLSHCVSRRCVFFSVCFCATCIVTRSLAASHSH